MTSQTLRPVAGRPFASRLVMRPLRSFAVACVALFAVACSNGDAGSMSGPSDPENEVFATALGVNLAQMTQRASRLYVQDRTVGTGAEALAGRTLRVRYTGWLRTGARFDGNQPSGEPFQFTLGVGQVIPGWDIGVPGMRVGGRRLLVFGSEYGYGAQGAGSIPPNATLVFEVELISVLN